MQHASFDATMSDRDFSKLRDIIHTHTGITIGETRKTMLVSRLRRRLREVDAPSFAAYITLLGNNPDELQEMTNRVTTNETYFYRTPRIWQYFQQEFVPAFQARAQNRTMRVWSAAASTGEEAHTIGALLEDHRLGKPGFDYSVLGTDVSSRVLDVAQAGVYKGRAVARFKTEMPELFARQLAGNETDGFKLSAPAKSRITFKLHNLFETLKHNGQFDAIFLRNVLIYFTSEDQEKILRNIAALIHPDGVLFIGESETLSSLNTGFEQVAPLTYQRTGGPKGAST